MNRKKEIKNWSKTIDQFFILVYYFNMKKINTKIVLKAFKLVLIIIWMVIVFLFSNQPGEKSTDTSMGFTKRIVTAFVSKTNLQPEEKDKLIEKLEPIARKLAHYTLYTIGGVLIINFINTFEIGKRKKILISIIIGFIYAVTDEFHQFFIEGRSASINDVAIDTLGVITGIVVFLAFFKLCKVKNRTQKIVVKCNKTS